MQQQNVGVLLHAHSTHVRGRLGFEPVAIRAQVLCGLWLANGLHDNGAWRRGGRCRGGRSRLCNRVEGGGKGLDGYKRVMEMIAEDSGKEG